MTALARVRTLSWNSERLNADHVQQMIVAGEHGSSRACTGKKKFSTYALAERARVEIERRYSSSLETYPCPFCKSFHLATKHHEDTPGVVLPIGY